MSHKLTAKQIKAIHFLVRGDSTSTISIYLKLRRETLSRWRQIPEFIMEYERVLAEAKARLQTSIEDILDTSMIALKQEINRYESDPKRIQTLLNVIKALEK
jgi:KaiC/GvpD/RAD55 family RecA-like ATPase